MRRFWPLILALVLGTCEPCPAQNNPALTWGSPGGDGTLLVNRYYVVLHSDAYRVPLWSAYRLTSHDIRGKAATRQDNFRPDPALPKGKRAELKDYLNSGYDKGHMSPAGDFTRNALAMSETFLLSNMCPQRPMLNEQIWRVLEAEVRQLAMSDTIWVVTGPLFLDWEGHPAKPGLYIGPDSVAVPMAFYKVILDAHKGTFRLVGFIMENRKATLPGAPAQYEVTVDSIEKDAGFRFFSKLPARDRLARLLPEWPTK